MYNKLFTKILDSSVWLEDTPTRIVWVTFIAMMDEAGFVGLSALANVANRARVSIDEAEAAIKTLESADLHQPDQEHEGRRIERVEGGWMVINAAKYRDIITRETMKASNRERVRRYRERKRESVTVGIRPVMQSEAVTDIDLNQDQDQRPQTVAMRSDRPDERTKSGFTRLSDLRPSEANPAALYLLTKAVVEEFGRATAIPDLEEEVKCRAAKAKLVYAGQDIHTAIQSVLKQDRP